MVDEGFIDGADVRLHYLASGDRGTPVVIAPGLADAAEDQRPILERLAPRRTVAMSFRGHGRSEAPTSGYDLDDHVSDLDAVVEALGLRDVVLFGHSRAVSYAVSYAATRPDRVASLVLGDDVPVHRAFPPEWIGEFGASRWRGQQVDDRVLQDVLRGIQHESHEVELWDALTALRIPVIAVLAGQHDDDVLAAATERYRGCGAQVVVLEDAGHALWEPDLERFVAILDGVAAAVDRQA